MDRLPFVLDKVEILDPSPDASTWHVKGSKLSPLAPGQFPVLFHVRYFEAGRIQDEASEYDVGKLVAGTVEPRVQASLKMEEARMQEEILHACISGGNPSKLEHVVEEAKVLSMLGSGAAEEAVFWRTLAKLCERLYFEGETVIEQTIAGFFQSEQEILKGETKGARIYKMVMAKMNSGESVKERAILQVADEIQEDFDNVRRLYYNHQAKKFNKRK